MSDRRGKSAGTEKSGEEGSSAKEPAATDMKPQGVPPAVAEAAANSSARVLQRTKPPSKSSSQHPHAACGGVEKRAPSGADKVKAKGGASRLKPARLRRRRRMVR